VEDVEHSGGAVKSESPVERERTSGEKSTMHDNIGFWCDCCSCEAEPQWQEVAEKLGIDLSDRE